MATTISSYSGFPASFNVGTPTVTAAQQGAAANANTLPGAPATGYDPRYGGVPGAPNPGSSSIDAILSNLANIGNITKLATGAGGASAAGARAQTLASMPMFDLLMEQFQKNIKSGSEGVIDPDVQALLNQKTAEYGVATGSPGSPASGAAALRAMGLTSYALKDQALRNMATLAGVVPQGPAFNPATMMVDPNAQLMWQWLANQLKSAPVPAAARADELNRQAMALRNGIRDAGGGRAGNNDLNTFLNNLLNRRGQGDTSSVGTGGTSGYPQTAPIYQTNPNATAVQSRRTEDDIINAWLDQIAPEVWPDMYAGSEDAWFDPSYANNEVDTADWWFDPGYENPAPQWSPADEADMNYSMYGIEPDWFSGSTGQPAVAQPDYYDFPEWFE